jgi:biopolymer transport protein TolR
VRRRVGEQRGFRRGGRRGDEVDLDITPMIDVVFLLLIFFMVSSTMQASPDQNVPVARYGDGVPTDGAIVIRIRNDKTGEPAIAIEKAEQSSITIEELTRYVQDRGNEVQRVIIKADRDIPHGVVRRVARAVNEVEGLQFYVGVQEAPRD